MKRLSQFVAAVAGVILAAACSDQQGPTPGDTPDPRAADNAITCRANMASRSMNCDSPSASGRAALFNVTWGGPQNTYVLLASGTPTYSGTTFAASVTVQNKGAQALGTADGTTPASDGVRVFFVSGPTVTGGTGTVTVANADGTATITAASQPYFQYNGVLAPGGAASAGKTWQFTVPNTVTDFTFSVMVNAKIPDENGVFRWVGTTVGTAPFDEVSEACGQLWAVGGATGAGTIQHYSGTAWAAQTDPAPTAVLHSVHMVCNSGTATGVAVGEAGTILYYDGTNWTSRSGGSGTLMSVNRLATKWYAVGLDGVLFSSADGLTWSPETSGVTDDLITVFGTSGTNLYAAGEAGRLLHSDGSGTWTSTGYTSGFTTATIRAGIAVGTEYWLVGDNGTITHSTNGTTFTAQTSGTTQALYGIDRLGTTGTDLYVTGGLGTILNYNGTAWTTQFTGSDVILNDVAIRMNGSTFTDAWAVGNNGTTMNGIR